MTSETTRGGILIAEDEEEIRELLAMMLESDGAVVFKAADGERALDVLAGHRYEIALLVTDLGLPKVGGIELITRARTLVPDLKVIAASGFGHAHIRTELQKVGVQEFFPKPFSPLELVATAKRLLKAT